MTRTVPAHVHCTDSTPLAPRYAGWNSRISNMAGLAAPAGRHGAERRTQPGR